MTAGPDIIDLDALAAAIPDGASIAIPPDYSGVAMEAVKALIVSQESAGGQSMMTCSY